MPQLSWKAVLHEGVDIALVTVPQIQGEDVSERSRKNVEDSPEDRRIGDQTKAGVQHLVTMDLTMLVEALLNNILLSLYHNAQSEVRSIG